ncbi:hypothetical protein HDU98_000333 [Podochytrium sp. JEL0797]|nr:hypothetical protein HDU98_000333 [Podochytrium sp. JEL0797]
MDSSGTFLHLLIDLPQMTITHVFTILASLLPLALALPGGAPKCKITETTIQTGHLVAQTSTLMLTMTAPSTYTPGGPAIPIQLTGTFPLTMGILAYATPGSTQDSILTAANGPINGGMPQHVGAFTGLAAQGMRAQTAASCTAQNVVNDAPESTATHLAPMLAVKSPMTLMWTPPATNMGPVTMNVVVAGSVLEPWMIVPSVTMASAAGVNALVAPVVGAANAAAVAANGGKAAAAVPAVPAGGVVGAVGTLAKGAVAAVTNLPGTLKDVVSGAGAGIKAVLGAVKP